MKHALETKSECPHPRIYSTRWDAYYCEVCDRWAESKCKDPDCEFCRDRPEKPSETEKKKNQ